jgi:16S rRNA (adenine1518-N6/adenine1519-N6)-dimethyltransferase
MLLSQIQDVCQSAGIKPSKSYGQNFLIDQNIVKKIIAGSGLKITDRVLEIGPGLGILTDELIKISDQVYCVELDSRIVMYLKDKYKKQIKEGKLKLIEGDALKIDFKAHGLNDFNFKIVANLPYSITSGFFRKFLEHGPKPEEIIVMIQKEVAQRMVAEKGKMNLLALSAQFFAEPKILFEVSAHCFWPEPKVVSAVIKLKLKEKLPKVDVKALFRLMHVGFSAKRKQLHNNLTAGFKSVGLNSSEVKERIIKSGLNPDSRAQDLSLNDWLSLLKEFN